MRPGSAAYWDATADRYQSDTRISCDDFHYGPLLPGDRELGLLPQSVRGMRCLEIGCGAAQNSIVLASRGAICTALDLSSQQLRHARKLVAHHGVQVALVQADMGRLPFAGAARFDLVHSAYALPFAPDQAVVIRDAARLLRGGGLMLLSTAHPLSTAEWLCVEGQHGIWVTDYHRPPADGRTETDGAVSCCQPVSLSRLSEWLAGAGLVIERLLEPRPLARGDPDAGPPYESDAWWEHWDEMRRVPVVAVLLARRRKQ